MSGAYHWHNGVYNQVHSPPSVHRDMNPDVVLYSQRLRDAGYRLGYVGKWHASYLRTPLDFGFHEVAGINGCDPALLREAGSESGPRAALHGTAEGDQRAHDALAGLGALRDVGIPRRSGGGHAGVAQRGTGLRA